MEKSKQNKILFKYFLISAVVLVLCCLVVVNAVKTAFIEREGWNKKSEQLITRQKIPAQRGNILSSNNEVLASTIKEYRLFFDFRMITKNGGRVDRLHKDTLDKYITPLCEALSKKLGDKSADKYKKEILYAYKNKNKRFRISKKWVTYLDLLEINEFPLIEKGRGHTGFFAEGQEKRENPYGSVASRTIGKMKVGKAQYGLELAYDSLLKGRDGEADFRRAREEYIEIKSSKIDEVNGCDIKTTIDISIQSIAENALLKKMYEVDADDGCVVVMEVATGEVRAIANFERYGERRFVESPNRAVSAMYQPGSTFKTVAVMAALDDGVVTPDEIFDTGNGIYQHFHKNGKNKRFIRDWNYAKGGFGKISVTRIMEESSNIGTAKIILKGYENNPQKFLDKLSSMGINDSVDLKLVGQAFPMVPKMSGRLWSFTTLPWMSFGYNVQIPPIYSLMFYNAIANGGKMVSPIFVSDIISNGEVIEHIEAKVLREQICKQQTLVEMRKILSSVVENGTASNLQSPYVSIAGKTGTVQIAPGENGYEKGVGTHRVSFCGYFPDDEKPKYSCIVVVTRPRGVYPSAGAISGEVLKNIAEQIYAQGYLGEALPLQKDSINAFAPNIKGELTDSTKNLCNALNVSYIEEVKEGDNLVQEVKDSTKVYPPSVIGMGLKDALYTLEKSKFRVVVNGAGVVTKQTPDASVGCNIGETVIINLE